MMVYHDKWGKKKKSEQIKTNKNIFLEDKWASRRQVILTRDRKTVKRKRLQERIVAWQPATLSDDTLPAVLGTVNKCVYEMLWRMFCTKETKSQCVV